MARCLRALLAQKLPQIAIGLAIVVVLLYSSLLDNVHGLYMQCRVRFRFIALLALHFTSLRGILIEIDKESTPLAMYPTYICAFLI